MSTGWSTPEDIVAKVRRRWDDGSLLRAYADGAPMEPIEVPLRGPRAAEIGDDLASARAWVAKLEAGRRGGARYSLDWKTIGGRHIGRNEIPSRALVSAFDQAWELLGTAKQVRRFDALLVIAGDRPSVRAWMLAHPLAALDLGAEATPLVAAFDWLSAHRGSGMYLRQISAPGVDTKFADRHRAVLAEMLNVPASAREFLQGLGLAARPQHVRLRVPASLGLPSPLTDLTLRADEAARLAMTPRSALIVENEITFLSVPVPTDGIVLWGRGFDVSRVGGLPWLDDVDLTYWGDIDTHGFAILDRLRAHRPHVRSTLMDAQTLLAHRDRWVVEERPAASALTHLTAPEAEVYAGLVADTWGDRVRLEQERIDWAWVEHHLTA